MISSLSIVFMAVSALICFTVPFVLAVVFKKKGLGTWKAFWFGALGFLVLQMFIRIPLLQVIGIQTWFISMNLVLLALFLSTTAGLFETIGRYLVFKLLLRKNRSYGDGLMAGLGHGGIEAIVIVGFTFINNIVLSLLANMGQAELMLGKSASDPAAQAGLAQAVDALAQTIPPMFLLGGIERIFTIVIHIALSLFVLEGIKRKKGFLYCLFAFLFHSILDFTAAILALNEINTILIEFVVLGFALLSLWYILLAKRRYSNIGELEAADVE